MLNATIAFVVDTSSSMNQKTANGMSLLDVAKSAIEHFIKMRTRQTHGNNQDRYLLVTCANAISQAIKVGWKDSTNSHTFLNTLKNLEANDLTTLGIGLKRAFDLLNQFRLQYNSDTYAQGRYPHRSEPSMVILFTDGSGLTSVGGVSDTLTLPNPQTYSSQLTLEPFRWEQRVYSCTLRFPSISDGSGKKGSNSNNNSNNEESHTDSNINAAVAPISEVTGGQSRSFTQMSQVMHYMDELATAASQQCVVVNFEVLKRLATNNTPDNVVLMSPHTTLYVPMLPQQQQGVGFWPIPESYYPDSSLTVLPPRTAHPTIYLQYIETDFLQTLQRNKFPCVDTYEIDIQSGLARYLLTSTPSTQQQGCYKAYVLNSGARTGTSGGPYGEPFGFVRKVYMPSNNAAAQNISDPQNYRVYIYVLPYNFLRFFYLIDELVHNHKMKPTNQWKQNFEKYVQRLPPYYINPLKLALKRYNIPAMLFPDHIDGSLSYSLTSYLKKMKKQEKLENEKLNSIMQQQFHAQSLSASAIRVPNPIKNQEAAKESDNDFRSLLQRGSSSSSTSTSSSATGIISSDTSLSSIGIAGSIDDSTSSSGLLGDDADTSSTSITNGGSLDANLSSKLFSSSSSFSAGSNTTTFTSQMMIHKNPFDISRSNLLQQLQHMSLHLNQSQSLFSKSADQLKAQSSVDIATLHRLSKQEIQKHSVPIHQMGNFDEVLRKRQVLRDPLAESKNPNQVNFGSPFQRRKRRSRSPLARRSSISQQQNQQDEGNAALLGDEMEIIEMKEEEEAEDLKSGNRSPSPLDTQKTDEVQSPLGIPLDTAALDNIDAPVGATSEALLSIPTGPDGAKKRKLEERVERYDKAKQQELVATMVNNNDPDITALMKQLPDKILHAIHERTLILATAPMANSDEKQIAVRNDILSIIKSNNTSRLNAQWEAHQRRFKTAQSLLSNSEVLSAHYPASQSSTDQISAILNKITSLKFINVQSERLFLREIITWAVEFKKHSIADALCNYERTLPAQ